MKKVLFHRFVQFREKIPGLLNEVCLVLFRQKAAGLRQNGFQLRQHLDIVLAPSFVHAYLLDRLSSVCHDFLC